MSDETKPSDAAYIAAAREKLVPDDARVTHISNFAEIRNRSGLVASVIDSRAVMMQKRIDAANEITDEMVEVFVQSLMKQHRRPMEDFLNYFSSTAIGFAIAAALRARK